jgi:N-acylneuraminate cytidylyltransferase/pseudaminic acid cytidylyltransferase
VPKSDIMFSSCSIPIVLPRHLVQDIDTPEDWIRAEMMYEVIKREQNEANSI